MNSRKPSWQEILTKIKNCFPEALTEKERIGEDGKPYIVHALKQEFLDEIKGLVDISDDSDRYELRFPGKRRARLQAQIPSYKTLIPKDGVDTGFNETGNLFIEGDNLDVLRMLRKSYRERIKMIYIDPPYNTGNDDFIYQDDFSQTQQEYLKDIGVLDEEGVQQISELKDGLRGRFHAGWLAMMYPRLKLARELLTDDGVIFISIDDNEQANLKLICDEIFGEGNFVGDIIWHSTKSVTNTALISSSYTHNLAYMKNKQYYVEHRYLFRLLESGQGFSNSDNDPRGPWKADPFQVDGWRPNQQYEIINPNTGKIYKPLPGKSWKNEDGKFKKLLEDNRIVFGKSGVSGPQRKRFLHEAEKRGRVSINLWSDLPTNTNATNDFISLMGGNYFSNPKPEKLIERFATLCTRNNDIVLDFFAGSATTAHAVMQLNAEDGGKRRFIMVQRPESIDPKKSKETYDFCIKNLPPPPPPKISRGSGSSTPFPTIADIARERIRRAGEKIDNEHPEKKIDIGFRSFCVVDSVFSRDTETSLADTSQGELLAHHTDLSVDRFEPLLWETLLETGVTLDQPLHLHEVQSYPFALCDRRCYCVTEGLTQEIMREIVDVYGAEFDTLYYLGDCPAPRTSHAELEAAIKTSPGDKRIEMLNFY